MKRSLTLFFYLSALIFFLGNACQPMDVEPVDTTFFLSEIRPAYFGNLDFESEEVIQNIPNFLETFTETYNQLEEKWVSEEFSNPADLEYMRLTGMYYGFYLLAITGNYLDENLTFADINAERPTGLFSGLDATDSEFEQKEMEALMERAIQVGTDATYNVNGYNDKSYGFLMAIKQVQGRLLDGAGNNNKKVMEQMIDYVSVRLVNYDVIANWNVLMSMVTITNYVDTINTFRNPDMDKLLFHVNARLVPGSLADLGGVYPEILGPIYRFDLNLKKIDWIMEQADWSVVEKIQKIEPHLEIMNTALKFIEEERTDLLQSWAQKHTVDERKEWLEYFNNNLKKIVSNFSSQKELRTFLNSENFKKAYQCYSCHRPSGLNE